MLDGLEITQFTYFQQCGGIDLDLVPAEITYGLERLVAFLQGVESVYDIEWTKGVKYADVRLADEVQFSVYNFEMANVERLWRLLGEYEAECKELLAEYETYPTLGISTLQPRRFPVLAAYDQVLKCSHLFNLLDARGAISVTERVGVIKRVRDLAVGTAKMWADQQQEVA
jgi:glycyl-tRNA synthetase alpha chain